MKPTQEEALEALRGEIRERFPVEAIIEELGSDKKPTDAVLSAATVLAGEIAPVLLEAIERAAKGVELKERESNLAFYGLHILGAARDTRAFPILMRILQLPRERLDPLLGDALTETIKRVAIGAFDGQAGELYALIADKEADEYVRLEMLQVLAFLAFEDRIDIEEAKRFLVRFDEERLAPEQDMAWCGWETSIALLGFRDLVPRVEAAWRDRQTPEGFSEPKYFFADLKKAETDWSNTERFRKLHCLGYIEDIVDELSWVSSPVVSDENHTFDLGAVWNAAKPYINPMRRVGRNEPCPCGSGKKAKRCCLTG